MNEQASEVSLARLHAAAALQDIFYSASKGEDIQENTAAMLDALWAGGKVLEAKIFAGMLRGASKVADEFLSRQSRHKEN